MKITTNGPRSKTNTKEMVTFAASTEEDQQSLRNLYDVLNKFGGTEVLVSFAESTIVGSRVEHISIVFE